MSELTINRSTTGTSEAPGFGWPSQSQGLITFKRGDLEADMQKSDGAPVDNLNAYLAQHRTEFFDNAHFRKQFGEYVEKAAAKNPEAIKTIFDKRALQNYITTKFSAGSEAQKFVKALLEYLVSPDRAAAFEKTLAKYFQKQGDGNLTAQSPIVAQIQKSDKASYVVPLIKAAAKLGAYDHLASFENKLTQASGKVTRDASLTAKKFIDFDMRTLTNKLDPHSGAVLDQDGNVFLQAASISPADISAMGFEAGAANCPVKVGTINWYSFVEKMRTLAVDGKMDLLADHVQETLATYVSWCRVKEANAGGNKEAAEMWNQMANNAVDVFKEGACGMPACVTDLVKKAFENAPLGTEVVHRILGGNAMANKGNSKITGLTEEIRDSKDAKAFQEIPPAAKGSFALDNLLIDANSKQYSILNPETLTSEVRTLTRSSDVTDKKVQTHFGGAAKSYEDSHKLMASSALSTVSDIFFKGARDVNAKAVEEFKAKHQERGDKLDTAIASAPDTAAKYKAAKAYLQKELEEFVTKADIKNSNLDSEMAGNALKTFVAELASKIQNKSGTFDEDKIATLFDQDISRLTNAILNSSKDITEGTGKKAVTIPVTKVIGDLVENLVTKDIVQDKTDKNRYALDSKSVASSSQEARKTRLQEYVSKRGFDGAIVDKLIAPANSPDSFASIPCDEIANIISENDALQDALKKHVPAHLDTYTKIASNPMQAGSFAYTLLGESHKDDRTRNATRFLAFMQLVGEANLPEAKQKEILRVLFRSHIKGTTQAEINNQLTQRHLSLQNFLKPTTQFTFKNGAGTTIKAGGLANVVNLLGSVAVRARSLSEASGLVINAENGVSTLRVAHFLQGFSGKSLEDLAAMSSQKSQATESVIEKAPSDPSELVSSIQESMPDEATRKAFSRYMGMRTDSSDVMGQEPSRLESDDVPGFMEKTMSFFKKLAVRLGMMAPIAQSKPEQQNEAPRSPTTVASQAQSAGRDEASANPKTTQTA